MSEQELQQWIALKIALPFIGFLMVVGYVYMAGRMTRVWLPIMNDEMRYPSIGWLLLGFFAIGAWPLWLTIKYFVHGIVIAWRFGIRGCLRMIAWPFREAWRAGAGEPIAKIPNARVVKHGTKQDPDYRDDGNYGGV